MKLIQSLVLLGALSCYTHLSLASQKQVVMTFWGGIPCALNVKHVVIDPGEVQTTLLAVRKSDDTKKLTKGELKSIKACVAEGADLTYVSRYHFGDARDAEKCAQPLTLVACIQKLIPLRHQPAVLAAIIKGHNIYQRRQLHLVQQHCFQDSSKSLSSLIVSYTQDQTPILQELTEAQTTAKTTLQQLKLQEPQQP